MLQWFLVSVFGMMTVVSVHAQTQMAVGVAAGYGQSRFSTDMPVLGPQADSSSNCLCPTFPDATGASYVPIAIATQLRVGDSTGLHWLFSGSVGLQVSNVNFAVDGDKLPYLDTNGEVAYSLTSHQLAVGRRSASIALGVGGEVAGFGLQVIGRTSYVYSAESANIQTYVSPPDQRFDSNEIFEGGCLLDDGRTIVIERIPTTGHHQVVFDVGAALSYSLFTSLASFPMVFTLQPYVFVPLTTVHVNYTTTERINYGCSLFIGVTL